jgi:hypothetical protein
MHSNGLTGGYVDFAVIEYFFDKKAGIATCFRD